VAEPAIEKARRVLELEPSNFHALSNLSRFLLLTGRSAEARELADRLIAVESDSPDSWLKKAEALSYLGDDRGVLAAFEAARRRGELPPQNEPLMYHLAAVAELRQGNADTARRHWQRVLQVSPAFDLARANLDDLRKPVRDRHAPWPFHLDSWIHRRVFEDLIPVVQAHDRDDERARPSDS
jgi:tetratricopeptide (TPR) repeat protein